MCGGGLKKCKAVDDIWGWGFTPCVFVTVDTGYSGVEMPPSYGGVQIWGKAYMLLVFTMTGNNPGTESAGFWDIEYLATCGTFLYKCQQHPH